MPPTVPFCQTPCQSGPVPSTACEPASDGWPAHEVQRAWVVHHVPGQRYPDGGTCVGRYGPTCRGWRGIVADAMARIRALPPDELARRLSGLEKWQALGTSGAQR